MTSISRPTFRWLHFILVVSLVVSLVIALFDVYVTSEVVYVSCVSHHSWVDDKYIESGSYSSLSLAGLSEKHLTYSRIPLTVLSPSTRSILVLASASDTFLIPEKRDYAYYKIYKVANGHLEYVTTFAHCYCLLEVAKRLQDGIYFIEYCFYYLLDVNTEFINEGPVRVSYIILEKKGETCIATYFDNPLDLRGSIVPDHILKIKVSIIPPWYAFLKICCILAYPLLAILTSYLLLPKINKTSKKRIFLAFLIAATLAYTVVISSTNLTYYYLYLKPKPVVYELKYGHFTVLCGFGVHLKIPYNTPTPLADLINKTALKHLAIFAKIMKADKVAVKTPQQVVLTGEGVEKIGEYYVFKVCDIDKVKIKAVAESSTTPGGEYENCIYIGVLSKVSAVLERKS